MFLPRPSFRPAARLALLITAFAAVACAVAVLCAPARAQFQVGLQDMDFDGTVAAQQSDLGYTALKTLGSSLIRENAAWAGVAPLGVTEPAGFDASNPSDPHYRWTRLDASLRAAAAHHVRVLLMMFYAPTWAQGPNVPVGDPNVGLGAWEPNATLYGQFVHAVAERYSGHFRDPLNPGVSLPRIKYFEIWNEENLWKYLAGPDPVGQYRNLLAAGYQAVKSVHPDNVAAVGGLAPISAQQQAGDSLHPLTFAEQLMCLRAARNHFVPIHNCHQVSFDAFSVHPYSLAATPTKPAYDRNDLLVADMHKLRPLLRAAQRLHTINSGPHPIWNTEWGWFTNPPSTAYGDSPVVAARYVAYAMYEMWKAGTAMVIWQTLADFPSALASGGGLETLTGQPKLQMQAFAFPFVASIIRRQGYAWGRAPVQHRVRVTVELQTRRGWRTVAKVRSGRDGVFTANFRAHGNGTYRAVVAHGVVSLPYFSAKIPPVRTHLYNFG